MLKFVLLSGLFSSIAVCAAEPPGNQAPSTRKMAERLENITRELDPRKNVFVNHARAAMLLAEIEPLLSLPRSSENSTKRFNLQFKYGNELLQGGEIEKAIQVTKDLEQLLVLTGDNEGKPKAMVLGLRATCYLRQGEQDNCLLHHNIESCLLPIRGAGVHTEQRGSRAAIEVLKQMLADAPTDLRARWLLNLSYMTVGEYPDKVPAPWLIPPRVFDSEYDIKHFPEVAPALGLDVDSLAGGVAMDDFDGDGNLDLMISGVGLREQLRFFRNNGDGTFSDRTVQAGLTGEVGGLNIITADYNNDGFLDFFVLRGGWMGAGGHYPNSLLRNNGNGTFTDVTEEAGMLSFHPTQTATWFDCNRDGKIDLFIANETASTDTPQPCELFRNNGD